MTTEPYASARRVFWIVDNGASHANWAASDRMSTSLAQRAHGPPAGARVLAQPGGDLLLRRATKSVVTPTTSPTSTTSPTGYWPSRSTTTHTACPFDWTFTRDDLNQLLHRLGHHDPHAPRPLAA